MTTLKDVKDVPMMVRISETNFYLREVPYNDQGKRPIISLDYEKLVTHARYNHYCISFLTCPYRLNNKNLLTHFDWYSRYLYFNFEESILLFDIFPRLEKLSRQQLLHLDDLLQQFPQAYQYDLQNADHRQKWALLKNSKFQYYGDFLHIMDIDKKQRLQFREQLQTLLRNMDVETTEDVAEELPAAPAKRREREASLYTYLKLNDDIPADEIHKVIKFLFDYLEEGFRQPYILEDFSTFFTKEDSSTLELVKGPNLDNQKYKVLFQELKNSGILIVSWPVIDRKVRVFSADGKPFANFTELSAGKIDTEKARRVQKSLSPLIEITNKFLQTRKKK
ncbi:hypothetical protein [Chitinophaga barathri]|uniref:Uncharacterized protein n=1 Tax=Chitinophaga barathri TaxID=1647451 RepID=A0A3N4MCX3_9BACT|nr:hypothetical protein [Chitinophaga barathri]RPD41285.1 hypothetical protein EG028_11450 [Chitinophaga barathri]